MEDETSGSEMSEDTSFSTTEESIEESEYGEDKTSMENDKEREEFQEKATDYNIDCWEDRTKKSMEDNHSEKSRIKEESSKNLKDKISGHLDDCNEIHGYCKYLEDTVGSEDGSSSSENKPKALWCKENEETAGNSEKKEWTIKLDKGLNKTSDLEVLLEPGRRGWIREVIYSKNIENHVVDACYLSPQGKGGRKRLHSTKNILSFLSKNNQLSDLTMNNFCTTRKLLGLGSGFEVTRKSLLTNTRKKEYKQFFTIIGGSSPLKVTCNLCSTEGMAISYNCFSKHMQKRHFEVSRMSLQSNIQKKKSEEKGPTRKSQKKNYQQFFTLVEGSCPLAVTCNLCKIEGKVERYSHFSDHMRSHHLPDETCSKCSIEIPAKIFSKHIKVCDGSETKLPRPSPRSYDQFFSKLKGASPTQVSCNLCNSKVPSNGYSKHFKRFHLPCHTCPVCHKDIPGIHFKKHTSRCDGSDHKARVLPKKTCAQLISEAISKSEDQKLTVSGICSYITKNYPSYEITRQTISNNLSSRK